MKVKLKKSISLFALMMMTYCAIAQYTYQSYENDPSGLRLYTLKNGLQVYLAKNQDEPKIQTYVAVRAGSTYDPSDNTGLAHYLEHMLFKGTDKIGAYKWSEEKKYLETISDLYEQHKAEPNVDKKKIIYKKIDSVSYEASKLCIANEYDKMISSIGASGTNAHTWHEETVYKNKIPSNELEKWLSVESERFSHLVLRLFHTELEAVYEEFNRAQDNDYRKVNYALMQALFPTHPYGQQTTIGRSEDLKNPSMKAIHKYFNKYYVPNNMCMVLVGDLDFDETIALVDQYFGNYKAKEVPKNVLPNEKPLLNSIHLEVSGPTAPSLSFAYRFNGIGSRDHKMVRLVDMILNNSSAGLIDINLNQHQKVQSAGCTPTFQNDYGWHTFYGSPKKGQSLEEVEKLILEEIEKIKKGDFDDWIIPAVINDLKLSDIKKYESMTSTASSFYNAFVHYQDWEDVISYNDELSKITKEEIIEFVKENYKDNYVAVYKNQGENSGIVKVENPGITPIETNRGKSSTFYKNFEKKQVEPLSPLFIDYKQLIDEDQAKGLDVAKIQNKLNDLFYLTYVYDLGSEHIRSLPVAEKYFSYLGTNKMTPEELKKEFYKLGIEYGMSVSNKRTYFYLSGLEENRDAGIKLFESLINNLKADEHIYAELIEQIAKSREDGKTQKGYIFWQGMFNKALYGENSPELNKMTMEEIALLDPEILVNMIRDFPQYKHEVFYYGKETNTITSEIQKFHKTAKVTKPTPPRKAPKLVQPAGQVQFYNYDMVQSEIAFVTKDVPFNVDNLALISVFNEYFGSGLSSIVFQEIRESKSLAYSAYATYTTPSERDKDHLIYAYLGTQANKLPQAVSAMKELLNKLPYSAEQFNSAKEAALKKIQAQRITKQKIYWNYRGLLDKGIDYDYRKEVYEKIKRTEFEDLEKFFNKHIKGKVYNYIVIGNEEDLDKSALNNLGQVLEVSISDLFVD